MILKGLTAYLRLSSRNTLKYIAFDANKTSLLTKKISYLESTQQPIINEQKKKKKYNKKNRNEQKSNHHQKYNEQDEEARNNQQNLARMIKYYRGKMESTNNKVNEITHHTKKIADYYKKYNHAQFVQQKSQIEAILQKITQLDFTNIQLPQYLNLLDFVRICSNIQSINYTLFAKTQDKVFTILKNFQKQIQHLPLNELSMLYCKVTPVYHPEAFTISGLLHDKLATDLQQNKKITISLMQMHIIIRSMGKKQFLSFPDKKILEMLLLSLKDKRIDAAMAIQLAVALKDIQVQVNISDINICEISQKIMARAVKIVQKGADAEQIQYLQATKKSNNPYFARIFSTLARKNLTQMSSQDNQPNFLHFKHFTRLIKLIPSNHRFEQEEKKAVIKFCERFLQKEQGENERKQFEFELLELIRADFFDQNLVLLAHLFNPKGISFIWSFPVQFSRKNIPFPLQQMQAKITENTSIFRIQTNNVKIAVSIAVQSRLHPQSQILRKCYNDIVAAIKKFQWSLSSLHGLVKFAVFDPYLISKFHNEYHTHYLSKVIPSVQDIRKEKQIKKGEKSQLLVFWQYLMIQNQAPHDLVSIIPIYAINLASFREKKIKNQQIYPKLMLLQIISLRLISGKIKYADHDSTHIIQLLIAYSSNLNFDNEHQCELYWRCVNHLIDQYGYLRKKTIPYANYLISKLLHIQNNKIKHSIYYKNFLMELIKAVGLLTISNSHDYFKTSIIREGLHANLISDLHLPQLQLAFFAQKQKNMLSALSGKYQINEFNPQNLVSFFKLPKLPQRTAADIDKILEVIENSTSIELSSYLTHYAFQNCKQGEKILNKICEKMISKLDVAAIDLMALLRNINQLSNSNFKLFEKVLLSICDKLLQNPSAIYLADHYQILRTIHQHGISHKNYENAIWEEANKSIHRGSIFITIMLQLNRKQHNFQFTLSQVELAEKFLLSNPQDLLKLFVYNEDIIPNMKQKTRSIMSHIDKPINQSLFLAYLESKYELIIAKAKTSTPVLQKANFTASKFLKLLQLQGVNVRLEEKHGQNIYHINDKVTLIFTNQRFANECKVINKMIRHLFPKQEIIQVNSEGGSKDNAQALNQLHILDAQTFTSELVEKIQAELRLN